MRVIGHLFRVASKQMSSIYREEEEEEEFYSFTHTQGVGA